MAADYKILIIVRTWSEESDQPERVVMHTLEYDSYTPAQTAYAELTKQTSLTDTTVIQLW